MNGKLINQKYTYGYHQTLYNAGKQLAKIKKGTGNQLNLTNEQLEQFDKEGLPRIIL